MIDGEENARDDGDAGEKVKARGKPIAEKQTGADGGDERLNVEDDVHDRRVPVLEREGEEDRPDSRAGEAGKDQVAPGAPVDLWNLF